jgi:hypothetical protein
MGTTAGGLPYPEENAPLADGALNVKTLAEALDGPPRGRAILGAAQSLASSTNATKVTLGQTYATGLTFGSNQFTVTRPGIYACTMQGTFATNATGYRSLRLYVNGALDARSIIQVPPVNGAATHLLAFQDLDLDANDTVALWALQNSGAAVDLLGAYTSLTLRWVAGPAV